ncbi:hypothetical protein JCM8202v2_003376 [Rhodotorula sphaerocarpa]
MFRISSSSRRRSAAAAGPLQSALLLLAAASTCATSVLEERDIGFCMSVRDCFNTHAYLPENAEYVCTARRSCSYKCKSGFTAANSICQQNCAVDSDCTTGPTSLNSHLACTGGGCLSTASSTTTSASPTKTATLAATPTASTPIRYGPVMCSTAAECIAVNAYIPANAVHSCSGRHVCYFGKSPAQCESGYTNVGGQCRKICSKDSECTDGSLSQNSHDACVNGACGWKCDSGYLSTGGGCLAQPTSTSTHAVTTTTTTPAKVTTTVKPSTTTTLKSSAVTSKTITPSKTTASKTSTTTSKTTTTKTTTTKTTTIKTTSSTTTTTVPAPTGTQCVVNSDCSSSIPANSHDVCERGFCTWGCERGYQIGFGGGGCVPITTTALPKATPPAATPRLTRTYAGSSFFDRWFYYNASDPTHGSVNYVGRDYADETNLTYVTKSGTAVMSVDRKSHLAAGASRDSVRLMSTDTYDAGNLIIIDLKHVPYGCGVWPAFWTFNWPWPSYGEIDVYEGINDRSFNQMTLHTEANCTRSGVQTGNTQWASPNCYAYSGGDNGCTVYDYDPTSYGAGFNAAGGGVFALQIAETGVAIWRWQRSQIPHDVQAGAPRPYTWGTPVAAWDGTTCDTRTFIKEQLLTFDVTLCGDWAGIQSVFERSDLSGACYPKYATCGAAVQDPAAFTEAYFEVNYIRVFAV